MKLSRIFLFSALAFLPLLGCSSAPPPANFGAAKQLSFRSYESMYHQHTYSCIWYAGSDQYFNYYVMENWQLNADKTDGHLINRDTYKIAVGDINIDTPMALTSDEDKWILLWPESMDQVQ
ncbi:MAG TPA: hypothetical protein VMD30_12790 [Tepidisphaeraceae bacterium]|nr:hypothetical protein [Tepidisphaeraceae bacterium]